MRNKQWYQHAVEIKEVLSSVRQDHINNLIEGIWETYDSQKQFFICGNGGSALMLAISHRTYQKGLLKMEVQNLGLGLFLFVMTLASLLLHLTMIAMITYL